jgi:hypothetical protein
LLAKQAITEALARYCRAMDRNDVALGYSVWHEDGVASYPPAFFGTGHAFVDRICVMHRERYTSHVHRLSQPLISVSGERAESEAQIHAVLWTLSSGELRQVDVFGRYLDRWSRRDSVWRIEHRDYLHEMDEVRPVGPGALGRERGSMGRRDRFDHSYTFDLLDALV